MWGGARGVWGEARGVWGGACGIKHDTVFTWIPSLILEGNEDKLGVGDRCFSRSSRGEADP